MLGDNDAAWDSAIFARFLEQYAAIRFKQTQAVFNWSKIIVLTQIVDEHTVVKFYRRRIPCSCLEKTYEQVKTMTKMGACYGPKCPSNGQVERSKTFYCSRCRNVTYCSRDCQKADSTIHKHECDKFVAEIAKFEAKKQSLCTIIS